eukprot:m.65880 g.65880  ORF g.65880 m.65880 type:complete len:600 (+) comp7597_c0_seq1:412-2211(+)
MFARPLDKSTEHALKGSERRRLLDRLQDAFPLLSEEQRVAIFPKSAPLIQTRYPGRIEVFSVDGEPLVFAGGDNQLVPTVYLLRRAPQLLQPVHVYNGVARHLRRGADLFMPGVVVDTDNVPPGKSWVTHNFDRFPKGALRAVVEEGSWAPVAVGRWAVASDELELRGREGTALTILHTDADELWRLGSQTPPAAEPPASVARAFEYAEERATAALAAAAMREQDAERARLEAEFAAFAAEAPRILKRKTKALRAAKDLRDKINASALEPDDDQREKAARVDELEAEIAEIEARLAAGPAEPTPLSSLTNDEDNDNAEEADLATDNGDGDLGQDPSVAGGSAGAQKHDGEAANEEEQEDDTPPMDQDELLLNSLLLALQTTLSNQKELPLLVSSVYAQHILPAAKRLAPHDALNVKQTKHKKIGAFLAAMAADGLLDITEEKKGVQMLAKFNTLHDTLLNFDAEEHLPAPALSDSGDADPASAAGKSAGASYVVPKSGSKLISIQVKKVRGNKNVTLVENLTNFGIALDEAFRKELARRFSASVSFAMGPDKKKGMQLLVQGKFAPQVQKFLMEQYGVPAKFFSVSDKGMTKKDKAINV